MEEFLIYSAKASVGTGLFYLVYWFFLRKNTLFNANRVFLLLGITVPLILPLLVIQYNVSVYSSDSINIFEQLGKTFKSIPLNPEVANSFEKNIGWIESAAIIYITGVLIFLSRLIGQTVELLFLIKKDGISMRNGFRVVENNKYGLPFSFFNIIFINPKFHSGTDLSSILTHEMVHIRKKHWFDLLLVELLTVFLWFNPFVWLFERSIKQNHEYLADEGVLAQGHSIGKYQSILINQIMGMQIIGITNNLNYSLNKKRMTMMTKTKTPKKQALRMLWALPATALLLFTFAKPAYVMASQANRDNATFSNTEERNIKVSGKITNDKGEPLQDVSVIIGGTTIGTASNAEGVFNTEIAKTDKIYFSYVGLVTLVKNYEQISKSEMKNGTFTLILKMEKGIVNLNIENILETEKPIETPATTNSNDEETFVIVEEMPSYPGGLYSFAKEIKEKTAKFRLSGKATIGYTVDEKGSIRNIQTIEKDNDKVAKAAHKIVSELTQWNPGKQRGKLVPVNYSVTINF